MVALDAALTWRHNEPASSVSRLARLPNISMRLRSAIDESIILVHRYTAVEILHFESRVDVEPLWLGMDKISTTTLRYAGFESLHLNCRSIKHLLRSDLFNDVTRCLHDSMLLLTRPLNAVLENMLDIVARNLVCDSRSVQARPGRSNITNYTNRADNRLPRSL